MEVLRRLAGHPKNDHLDPGLVMLGHVVDTSMYNMLQMQTSWRLCCMLVDMNVLVVFKRAYIAK